MLSDLASCLCFAGRLRVNQQSVLWLFSLALRCREDNVGLVSTPGASVLGIVSAPQGFLLSTCLATPF